jgi:hypothetical protein
LAALPHGRDWTFAWTPDNSRNVKIAAALRRNTELETILHKQSINDGVHMLVYRIKYSTNEFMP